MFPRRKKLLTVLTVVLSAGLLYGIFLAVTDVIFSRRYERAYPQIKIGDSKDLVTKLMGQPGHTANCEYAAFPDSRTDLEYRKACVQQYWYDVFLKDYVISFDKEGRVIAKNSAVSP